MKRTSLIVGAALAALFISGCATDPPQVASQAPQQDPREAMATAVATCATAIERIATTANGDAASKVAAVGAIERMCGQGSAHFAALQAPQQQSQSLGQTLWQAALQTADLVLRGYGIKTTRDVAITQSNNAAQTTIASYGAFQGMASTGFNSNATIARFIQAPQANVTTNTTLSGTGVLGSGTYTYSAPVTNTTTTTRTCNGGNGAAGAAGAATTTGGNAAPGGPATC